MLVYEGIKKDFIDDVDLGIIADKIRNKYIEILKRRPSTPEFNSWKNSMQYMRGVLSDEEIPFNTGIAIEYNIPPTGCRIDFMMSGYINNNPNVVIVELKQWDKCTEVQDLDGIYKVNTYTGGGLRDVNHPSYQAMTYANLISDYNEIVQIKNINIIPCAYLHNYYLDEDKTLLNDNYKKYTDKAPLFGHNDVRNLRKFIKKYIEKGDNGKILYEIDNGKIKPSKMLQDTLSNMLEGNQEFYMIDNQKIVYEYALKNAIDTVAANDKNVMIVRGGPGTGKSVLAINLLVEFTKRNMTCFYVTKNSAPRYVFEEKLKGKKHKGEYINHLFQGSGKFINEERNKLDCLVVDEAHRLNAKSGMFQNLGENQVKEIINASKFSIFFIDENQKVTLKDIGTEQIIRDYAKELGAGIHTYELESQFRCNGSDGYIAWLDNTLQIRNTANLDINDFNYDFKIFDDPNELRKAIVEKNSDNKARLVAGYCWDWIKTGKNRTDVHDIIIPEYNFSMSWNLGNTGTWAIDKNSVDEIGCIHTCQGLEFDYIGVIIGDDIRYEKDKIITDYTKRAKTDQSLKGIKKIAKYEGNDIAYKIADSIIKNTYKTLMTRGMKGCYIYCVDKGMQKYLKNKINKQ